MQSYNCLFIIRRQIKWEDDQERQEIANLKGGSRDILSW